MGTDGEVLEIFGVDATSELTAESYSNSTRPMVLIWSRYDILYS